jgi:hypothetical protein
MDSPYTPAGLPMLGVPGVVLLIHDFIRFPW